MAAHYWKYLVFSAQKWGRTKAAEKQTWQIKYQKALLLLTFYLLPAVSSLKSSPMQISTVHSWTVFTEDVGSLVAFMSPPTTWGSCWHFIATASTVAFFCNELCLSQQGHMPQTVTQTFVLSVCGLLSCFMPDMFVCQSATCCKTVPNVSSWEDFHVSSVCATVTHHINFEE